MKLPFVALALAGAVLASFGQVSFKHGADGRTILTQFMNGWILLGFAFYMVGTALWIIALSAVPLSVVYPFAALTYVLVNVLAVALLGEHLSMRALAGTGCVLVGLFLVATSFEVSHGP
jgi:drug/metabolite transporter (DMT)-like permease